MLYVCEHANTCKKEGCNHKTPHEYNKNMGGGVTLDCKMSDCGTYNGLCECVPFLLHALTNLEE